MMIMTLEQYDSWKASELKTLQEELHNAMMKLEHLEDQALKCLQSADMIFFGDLREEIGKTIERIDEWRTDDEADRTRRAAAGR